MEFDPAAIPTESTMVRCIEEGLKPSIKAKIDQDATHLDDYEELVAKAVRARLRRAYDQVLTYEKLIYRSFEKVDPLIPPRTKSRPREQ